MNLPMLVTPTYVDVIPSTKQKVEYRPFLVKEEKILLMALEEMIEKRLLERLNKYLIIVLKLKVSILKI